MASNSGQSAEGGNTEKGLVDLFGELEKGDINSATPPSVKFLEWFHRNVSTERDADHHHKIGMDEGDVARGQHDHDGKNSLGLWVSTDVPTDPLATLVSLQAWAVKVNDLLRTKARS